MTIALALAAIEISIAAEIRARRATRRIEAANASIAISTARINAARSRRTSGSYPSETHS